MKVKARDVWWDGPPDAVYEVVNQIKGPVLMYCIRVPLVTEAGKEDYDDVWVYASAFEVVEETNDETGDE